MTFPSSAPPYPATGLERSLRAALASIVPTWITNVPGFRNVYSYLYVIALLGDCLREMAWEGQLAAYPGVGTPDALPLIGQSRALTQGPSEPDATFVQRCITYRQALVRAGSAIELGAQIQDFLVGLGTLGAGVYPVLAVIDRNGYTATLNADQSVTISTQSWDWDDFGGYVDGTGFHPGSEVDGWWSDNWIIITDIFSTHYTSFSDTHWTGAYGSGDQTLDSLCPQSVVQGLMSLIAPWKGAHMYVRGIIWVPSVSAFFATPNGFWGNWSHNFSGPQVPTRTAAYSYWHPLNGAGV